MFSVISAVQVVEKELREHGQKAENASLKRCSMGLRMLLSLMHASSSAKDAQAEDTETAKAIRALTRHGLLCHLNCYTTEAGKALSLVRNNTDILIQGLRILCEYEAPDFMTPELFDALARLYEVHQAECDKDRDLKECKQWILKLKRERDESKEVGLDARKLLSEALTR